MKKYEKIYLEIIGTSERIEWGYFMGLPPNASHLLPIISHYPTDRLNMSEL
jgi:hypothetical protein